MAKPGFREVGIYRRHGKLDGVRRDCVIVERLLGSAARQVWLAADSATRSLRTISISGQGT
jgi:hypothetical protein